MRSRTTRMGRSIPPARRGFLTLSEAQEHAPEWYTTLPEDRMDSKQLISSKLAEWGLTLSNAELDQLAPAYEKLLRWQGMLEQMLQSRPIADGINFPESEPIVIHALERTVSDGRRGTPAAVETRTTVSGQKATDMNRAPSH